MLAGEDVHLHWCGAINLTVPYQWQLHQLLLDLTCTASLETVILVHVLLQLLSFVAIVIINKKGKHQTSFYSNY